MKEGLLRLMESDVREPLNIGSEEMVSMQEMVEMICSFEGKQLSFIYTAGPVGVRYRGASSYLHSQSQCKQNGVC